MSRPMENNPQKERVVVFGFSENPERYSFKAAGLLRDYGHDVIAFNPREQELSDLPADCDTLTMYVNPAISQKFKDNLLRIKCKRIIFNPGSENTSLEHDFKNKGVEIIHGCTLVMLRTGQF